MLPAQAHGEQHGFTQPEGQLMTSYCGLVTGKTLWLLAAMLAGGLSVLPVAAQSANPAGAPLGTSRYRPERFPRRAELYYGLVWG